jgi:hypothetical protein
MADPQPVILYSPSLKINDVELKCLLSHIELNPDVSTVEVKTGCGTREYPGTVKWQLKASLYHCFDPEGTNTVLTEAVQGRAPVPFSVIPNGNQPVSATNPEFTGDLIPQPFTPLSGDIGDASSFDLEWSISGWLDVPTTNITPALAAQSEPAPDAEPPVVVEEVPVSEVAPA